VSSPWPTDEPDRPGDVHSLVRRRLLERRVVVVSGELDTTTATDVAAQLMLLDATGDEPIELHLSCPDADLDAALTLADTIELLGVEVRARATGRVGGAALAPYVAATVREASAHAVFVLHEPRAAFEGRAQDLEELARSHAERIEALWRRIASRAGRSVDEVRADAEHGRLFGAHEADDYGLVDRVL
jgi:ATP-dependent Clp protease, protease subunit